MYTTWALYLVLTFGLEQSKYTYLDSIQTRTIVKWHDIWIELELNFYSISHFYRSSYVHLTILEDILQLSRASSILQLHHFVITQYYISISQIGMR